MVYSAKVKAETCSFNCRIYYLF